MKTDYLEESRKSVRRDFERNGRKPRAPHPKNTRRVEELGPGSSYWQYRRLIVGKLVRILRKLESGCWVEFVNESDRLALNRAAGWTDDKRYYLLDSVRFD